MYRYKKADGVCGLYRTPGQIKRDIDEISERIADVMFMLNIRAMISETISESSIDDAKRCAEAIGELVEDAKEALTSLGELERELDELRDELSDSIAIMGCHSA